MEEDRKLRKNQSTCSMKEAMEAVTQQLRESSPTSTRSVSFNGVSVMVETLMSVYKSIAKNTCTNTALAKAVLANDICSIQQLMAQQTVSLESALLATVEQDRAELLASLLPGLPDLNTAMEECGHGLLHASAAAGSMLCAGLLLDGGARPDLWDTKGQATPLHAAAGATNNARQMVELLLNNGANINSGMEKDGGSVLHSAVRAGSEEVVQFLLENKAETVPKTFFETALHIAAEHNNVVIAHLLLERNPRCVDSLRGRTERSTALHLAADSGYFETCKILLAAGADVSLANGHQMTAVHLAARNRTDPVLRLLLTSGASKNTGLVNALDADGRTPLFVCTTSKGHGATDCMTTLLEFGAKVDVQNSGGYTALHMAAIDRKPARVNLLISRDADLSMKNNAGFSALHFINKKVPQCMRSFEERLDQGLKLESANSEMSAKVKMDFNKLSSNINSLHRQDITIFMELMNSSYHSMLKHPLSQAFLYLKWNQIKYIYLFFSIFCHFVYSTVYTTYALLIFGTLCEPKIPTNHTEYNMSYVPCTLGRNGAGRNTETEAWFARIAWLLLIFFTFLYIIFEGINVMNNTRRYLGRSDSYINIFLILSFFLISFHEDPFEEKVSLGLWQFHVAALGCFLTWLQMMFYVGKLPRFGKYVQMFRTVAGGFVDFMVAWISLIMAFAISVMIMFPHNDAFSNLPFTVVKLFVMMLGEINDDDLYYRQSQSLNPITNTIVSVSSNQVFVGTAHFIVLMFIFLVSIILMNLLVGLAVSDIQGLSKSAKLNQLIQQVDLINYMEGWLFSPIFGLSPEGVQKFLRSKLQGLKGQNYNMVYTSKPFDINDRVLPESLKRAVYDNCIR